MSTKDKSKTGSDAIWPGLETAIKKLLTNLNDGFDNAQWMGYYTQVYQFCTNASKTSGKSSGSKPGSSGSTFVGGALYNKLQAYLRSHLKDLNQTAESKMDESLLNFYKKEWDRFTTASKYVSHLFQYLNRFYIKRELDDGKEVYEVYPLSLVTWKQVVFQSLKTRLTPAVIALIEKERNNEQIDANLVHGVVMSSVSLGIGKDGKETSYDVYKTSFEDEFLRATEKYYVAESDHFIATNSISDYMKKVESRLQEEEKRVRLYLHASTEKDLLERCDKVLIDKRKDQFWAEFQNLLEKDQQDDLARMYSLLSRKTITNGLDPLKDVLEKHVVNIGTQALAESDGAATDPKVYVEIILKVYKRYNELVNKAFQNDAGFVAALDKGCRRFINENSVTKSEGTAKSPELLAKYCDTLLKKSPKNPEEQETLEILNDVMLVFKYIEEKDVFQTFYSKMLAKRLIHGTSHSEYLEGQMISKLKQNCGYDYTSKLARMFGDITVSKELLGRYLSVATKEAQLIDFTVLVLATGSWPLQPPNSLFTIPKEMSVCELQFTRFYQGEFSGRKLAWLHQLSKGEVKTKYGPSSGFTFQCSTYQMGVLVQFNTSKEITAEDLQIATQLNDTILRQTLLSLVRTKVLEMEPEDENIGKDHKFKVNFGYKSKRTRVQINIPIREAPGKKEEIDATQKLIEEDRKIQIQAAIVRIMKSKKTLNHANLVTEVIAQLQNRFKPKVPIIKRCIDIMIEKDFLERSEQKDIYNYKA